jgi:large subunit ribosomal protein L25
VKVPVHVIGGTPAGVKEGGILHYKTRELHVECLPGALPDHIEVDASGLAIGQGIHLKEMAKIESVRFLDDPDQMVVSVAVPMSDAKLEALLTSQAAGPEGAKEPEVAAKGKAADEGAEAVAAPGAPGAAAPAAGVEAKAGDKKEGAAAAAPKAEKKEAEKKK